MKRMICALCIAALLALPIRAEEGNQYLALTFDDGPSGRFTAELLDGLAQREVHATFFLCGYRVDQYPALAARIAEEGHEIGVHGDTHKMFSQLSQEELCRDLLSAREKITEATGEEPTLLRPPGGQYDLKMLEQTACADLPVILWSVDPHDWCRNNCGEVANSIIGSAKNGDIILMHDMSASSVKAALAVIDRLEDQGFEFVTVSELAYLSQTKLEGNQPYSSFKFAKKLRISWEEAATEP